MAACLLPGHLVFRALMRCQLSPEHLHTQHLCTLRSLVWNVPSCSPNDVLTPPLPPHLSSVGLPCPTPA